MAALTIHFRPPSSPEEPDLLPSWSRSIADSSDSFSSCCCFPPSASVIAAGPFFPAAVALEGCRRTAALIAGDTSGREKVFAFMTSTAANEKGD